MCLRAIAVGFHSDCSKLIWLVGELRDRHCLVVVVGKTACLTASITTL